MLSEMLSCHSRAGHSSISSMASRATGGHHVLYGQLGASSCLYPANYFICSHYYFWKDSVLLNRPLKQWFSLTRSHHKLTQGLQGQREQTVAMTAFGGTLLQHPHPKWEFLQESNRASLIETSCSSAAPSDPFQSQGVLCALKHKQHPQPQGHQSSPGPWLKLSCGST